MNRKGELFYFLEPSENSTEAIINYLYNTTYNLNFYIKKWEDERLGEYAAPGLNSGGWDKC